MRDKLFKHIKRKLIEKDVDHFDIPSDDQIKYFMLSTFENC